ncbi:MAG TPA: sugar phosphate isomerase/epimerase family protein [Acidobacteriota bacterium]|nr:sugar phosphate isomerase/epimerase family protein [Acidobacteriota bacterium]
MTKDATRREFLKASLGVAAAASLSPSATAASQAAPKGKMLRGVVWGMLPEGKSIADRFKMAADAGFDAVEGYTTEDPRVAEDIKKSADAAKIRITSVMNQAHWDYPLSSADPAAIKKSIEGMKTSLRNAKLWGADAVLLVPGVVNPQTRYQEAYDRSRAHIRELIPFAEEQKVIIAVEEVWNKFLLSPMEFAGYVDSFKSPWVRAYFDVGNVLLYGYPQDWIRTLGKRIVKVHLKDFKVTSKGFSPFTAAFVNLGEGDAAWPEIRKALGEIGYSGTVTAELDSGDLAYLTDVRKRIDKLVLGI